MQAQGGVNSRVDKSLDDIKSQLTLLTQALTLTEKGKFPAQAQPNPSRQVHSAEASSQSPSGHDHVASVTTLRSGKIIDKTIIPRDPTGRGDVFSKVGRSVQEEGEYSGKKQSEGLQGEWKKEKEHKEEKDKKKGFWMSL